MKGPAAPAFSVEWAQLARFEIDARVHWATAADFDGDGLIDLALGTDDGIRVYHHVPLTAAELDAAVRDSESQGAFR